MKKICLVVPKYFQNNEIFNAESHLNRDDIFNKYIELRKEFEKYDCILSTNDINNIEESDAVIYFDMPKFLPKTNKIDHSYLVLTECELIRPDNYDREYHKSFDKIFTWQDDLVDNKKYFKLNFSHLFPLSINKKLSKKDKLCILIAGNKTSPIESDIELYSKRIEAIRWFETNHPESFDLYGVGWERRRFEGPRVLRALNRVPFLSEIYATLTGHTYPSYQGRVHNKKEVMEKYKFSICYENARNIPGYITEKIFDSFFSGCIPIYWGANNISDHVPDNCFIDRRNFSSYEELYNYITEMSDKLYMSYLNNIENYLTDSRSFQFTGRGFSETLVFNILRDANDK